MTGEEVQAVCVNSPGQGVTGEALALGAKSKEVPIASETNIFLKKIYFYFLAVMGLHCCTQAFSS